MKKLLHATEINVRIERKYANVGGQYKHDMKFSVINAAKAIEYVLPNIENKNNLVKKGILD